MDWPHMETSDEPGCSSARDENVVGENMVSSTSIKSNNDTFDAVFACCRCKGSVQGQPNKLLVCLHAVCDQCYIDHRSAEGEFTCPICVIATSRSSVIENFVAHVLDTSCKPAPKCASDPCPDNAVAQFRCVPCEDNLCAKCKEAHQRVKYTKDHQIQLINGGNSMPLISNICATHPNEELVLFCNTCKILTCRACQLSQEHSGHHEDYSNVDVAAETQRNNLLRFVTMGETKSQGLISRYQVASESLETLEKMRESYKKEVRKAAESLMLKLQHRVKELAAMIDGACDQRRDSIVNVKIPLERTIEMTKQALLFSKAVSSLPDKHALLRAMRSVHTQCRLLNTACKQHNTELPHDVLQPMKLTLPTEEMGEAITRFGESSMDTSSAATAAAPTATVVSQHQQQRPAPPTLTPQCPAPPVVDVRSLQQQLPLPPLYPAGCRQTYSSTSAPHVRSLLASSVYVRSPNCGPGIPVQRPQHQMRMPTSSVLVTCQTSCICIDCMQSPVQYVMSTASVPARPQHAPYPRYPARPCYVAISTAAAARNSRMTSLCYAVPSFPLLSTNLRNSAPVSVPSCSPSSVSSTSATPPYRAHQQSNYGNDQPMISPLQQQLQFSLPVVPDNPWTQPQLQMVQDPNAVPHTVMFQRDAAASSIGSAPAYSRQQQQGQQQPQQRQQRQQQQLQEQQRQQQQEEKQLQRQALRTLRGEPILPYTTWQPTSDFAVSPNRTLPQTCSDDIITIPSETQLPPCLEALRSCVEKNGSASAAINCQPLEPQMNGAIDGDIRASSCKESTGAANGVYDCNAGIEVETIPSPPEDTKSASSYDVVPISPDAVPDVDRDPNGGAPSGAVAPSGTVVDGDHTDSRMDPSDTSSTVPKNGIRTDLEKENAGTGNSPFSNEVVNNTIPISINGTVPRRLARKSITTWQMFDSSRGSGPERSSSSSLENSGDQYRYGNDPSGVEDLMQAQHDRGPMETPPLVVNGQTGDRVTPDAGTVTTSDEMPRPDSPGTWDDYCSVCNNGGDLVCCEAPGCRRVFHHEHHIPPLKEIPKGVWHCTFCIDLEKFKTEEDLGPRDERRPMTKYELKVCQRILLKLYTHCESVAFHEPVDESLTEYYEAIKKPMDFSCIRERLDESNERVYKRIGQFVKDMNQVFINCDTYNTEDEDPQLRRSGVVVGQEYKEQIRRYFPDLVSRIILTASSNKRRQSASPEDGVTLDRAARRRRVVIYNDD